MKPTRLNLLPEHKRSHLQRLIFVQFFKNGLESIVLILCISGIILLRAQWVLQDHFNDLNESIAVSNNAQASKNLEIKAVNRIITQTDLLQKNYTLWTPILEAINDSIPPGIVLSNLALETKNNRYTFTGKANTREDLLALQTMLESLDFIKSVDIPLSQLTAKQQVPFSIVATTAGVN